MGCDIHAMIEAREIWDDGKKWGWINRGDPDVGRNYDLFAILAGVRNSHDIPPISEPRGVPEDACQPFRYWRVQWESGAHSASFVTLAEMKAYDGDREIYDGSLILSKDSQGNVTSTCKATTGKHMGPVGTRKIFGGPWGRAWWDSLIAKLEAHKGPRHTDEDVRVVFFFDN